MLPSFGGFQSRRAPPASGRHWRPRGGQRRGVSPRDEVVVVGVGHITAHSRARRNQGWVPAFAGTSGKMLSSAGGEPARLSPQPRVPPGRSLNSAGEIFRRLRAGDDGAAAEDEAG